MGGWQGGCRWETARGSHVHQRLHVRAAFHGVSRGCSLSSGDTELRTGLGSSHTDGGRWSQEPARVRLTPDTQHWRWPQHTTPQEPGAPRCGGDRDGGQGRRVKPGVDKSYRQFSTPGRGEVCPPVGRVDRRLRLAEGQIPSRRRVGSALVACHRAGSSD